LSVITNSWFVLGGAFSCAVLSGQHLRLARKARAITPAG
jgi:hypothetical protein